VAELKWNLDCLIEPLSEPLDGGARTADGTLGDCYGDLWALV